MKKNVKIEIYLMIDTEKTNKELINLYSDLETIAMEKEKLYESELGMNVFSHINIQ